MFKFLLKRIHPSWAVVWFFLGIILGVILGFSFRIRFFSSVVFIVFSISVLVVGIICSRRFILVLVLVAGIILAFFRISGELYGEEYIQQFFGQTILVSGMVEGDPESDFTGTKIKLVNLEFGNSGISVKGSIYISAGYMKDLVRSDIIELSGKLFEGFGTFSGYMYKPEVLSIRRAEPGDLVIKIRDWFARRVSSLIPEPEVSLGLSYLLGMKSGLPEDLDENLRVVGLVHIVVASGAHLSILVEIARKIFGRVSRFSGLLFSILFVVFFMCMVGWTPSILRAGLMTILSLVAWFFGRKFAVWRIILIVAAVTLMIDPNFLFNLGWLLSFASYAGIMMLGPILTKFFYGEKKPGFISSIILTTVSATLMTLPIILYFYGTVSLISVLANLLILPTLPYAMGLVFLTGVFAGAPLAEVVISFLATKLLDFHILVVEFFGGQKSLLIEIPTENVWVFLIYSLILIMMLYNRKHE